MSVPTGNKGATTPRPANFHCSMTTFKTFWVGVGEKSKRSKRRFSGGAVKAMVVIIHLFHSLASRPGKPADIFRYGGSRALSQ